MRGKIRRVKNVEELVKLLKGDRPSYGDALRFNWRLVFLPDYSRLRDFFNEVSREATSFEVFHLENYIKPGKKWLDDNDIFTDILKKIKSDRNAVLFSLDSVLRFFPDRDLENLFQRKLCILENLQVNRVLILPICGMEERVLPLLQQCPRFADGLLPPPYVLEKDKQDKVEILLIDDEEFSLHLNPINDFKEFLEIWKDGKSRKFLVSLSSLLGRYKNPQPDSAVTVRRLKDKEELLKHYPGFRDEIHFKNGEFIKKLLEEVFQKRLNTWRELLQQVPDTLESFFKNFPELKGYEYEAWKFVNCARSLLKEEYSEVVRETLEESLRALYSSENVGKEEKLKVFKMLKGFHPLVFNRLCSILGKLTEDLKLNLAFLPCEKGALLRHFSKGKITLDGLRERFKEVSHYLESWQAENCSSQSGWIYRYFDLYREGKLKNHLPQELVKILEELNRDFDSFSSWYHSFPTVKELSKGYKKVVILDCVGIEWLPYLLYLLKEVGYSVKKVLLARSELPTTTEFNTVEGAEKIDDFDRLAHDRFEFPDTVIKQFELLKELIQSGLPSEEEFVLTSDHGATTFSRFANSLNLCREARHNGRYCEEKVETSYGFALDNNLTVAKFHNSLGRKPVSEAHGGATPEEVLVSFIVIGEKERSYRVNLLTEQVRRGGELLVTFEPEIPENLQLFFSGEELKFSVRDDIVVAEVPFSVKAGIHKLKVLFTPEERTFKVKVAGGLEEEELL